MRKRRCATAPPTSPPTAPFPKGTTPARTTDRPLGAILAGGASRRFGSPKARAPVGGVALARRVADALAAAGLPVVTLVASKDQSLPLAAPARCDEVAGAGPLGGIAAALAWADEQNRPGAVCVACDLPYVPPGLLRHLAERGVRSGALALVPAGGGRWGVEPLCAYYSRAALPTVRRRALAGELQLGGLLEELDARVVPAVTVRRWGDPATLFLNVNTPDDRRRAERLCVEAGGALPPVVCIVGRKNSGKTTLLVAVVRDLARRGLRVATAKHGHHTMEFDRPGRDSWRHFNEGEAAATLLISGSVTALMTRWEAEPDAAAVLRHAFAGTSYDLILVEGYKGGPYPKIEVHRSALYPAPLHGSDAAEVIAMVSDASDLPVPCPVLPLDAGGAHVAAVADLLQRHLEAVRA